MCFLMMCHHKCRLILNTFTIWHKCQWRKHSSFYMEDFIPFDYFKLVTAANLRQWSQQPEVVWGWTWDLKTVPKGFAILAGSQWLNFGAKPVTKDTWPVMVQSQFRLLSIWGQRSVQWLMQLRAPTCQSLHKKPQHRNTYIKGAPWYELLHN